MRGWRQPRAQSSGESGARVADKVAIDFGMMGLAHQYDIFRAVDQVDIIVGFVARAIGCARPNMANMTENAAPALSAEGLFTPGHCALVSTQCK